MIVIHHSTAKEVEAIVRAEGATPATVGVIEGEVCVGLSSEELDRLARCDSSLKVSRRDLPYVISKVRLQLTQTFNSKKTTFVSCSSLFYTNSYFLQ